MTYQHLVIVRQSTNKLTVNDLDQYANEKGWLLVTVFVENDYYVHYTFRRTVDE